MGKLPYTVSQDKKSGAFYCHRVGYPNIPVFGSIGDKYKAKEVCRVYNMPYRERSVTK